MAKWHEALQEGKANTASGQAMASQNVQVCLTCPNQATAAGMLLLMMARQCAKCVRSSLQLLGCSRPGYSG